MPYEQFIEERIFKPLGMTDTTFWPSEEQLKRHPDFYQLGPNKKGLAVVKKAGRLTYPLSDRTRRYPIPGSGLFSTATDMMKFCQMFMNNGVVDGKTLLSPASVKAMTTKETPPNIKYQYGFGWATDHNTYSHGGSYHTFMKVWPADGLITIWMTQIQGAWDKPAEKIGPHFQAAALAQYKQHP
jgi:CubicO group peptidase (beta-lactamase class C family)